MTSRVSNLFKHPTGTLSIPKSHPSIKPCPVLSQLRWGNRLRDERNTVNISAYNSIFFLLLRERQSRRDDAVGACWRRTLARRRAPEADFNPEVSRHRANSSQLPSHTSRPSYATHSSRTSASLLFCCCCCF